MNIFTDECVRGCMSLVSGIFNTLVCGCLFSFCFTSWIGSNFCAGMLLSSTNFLPLLPHSLCLFIFLHPTFPSLSASCFFSVWYFPRCVVSQFSQSTACATVCICSLITDAPNWQQVQLCMDVCLSLISQEILSRVVQNVSMCVCSNRDCVPQPRFCLNISVFICVQFAVTVVIMEWWNIQVQVTWMYVWSMDYFNL